MKTLLVLLLSFSLLSPTARAQTDPPIRPMSQRMVDAFMSGHPDSMLIFPAKEPAGAISKA